MIGFILTGLVIFAVLMLALGSLLVAHALYRLWIKEGLARSRRVLGGSD